MRAKDKRHAKRIVEIIRGIAITACACMVATPVFAFYEVPGDYQGVYLNGQLVGVCESADMARDAYLNARRKKNSEGLSFIDVDVDFQAVKAVPSELSESAALSDRIYEKLDSYRIDEKKTLAYNLKINNYTVTLSDKEEVLKVLKKAESEYDADGRFEVYMSEDNDTEAHAMTIGVKAKESNDTEAAETSKKKKKKKKKAESSQEDGVVDIAFDSDIKVFETYVDPASISDADTAYQEITKENEEPTIYEVKAGDSLSGIANDHGLRLKEMLAMNPGLTSESDIYVGDDIVITAPEREISVVVSEKKTYEETYSAETIYKEDDSQYAGTNTVVQEAKPGKRVVTALVSYKDGAEAGREIIEEKVIAEAVPKIVKKGTKNRPTYIYPVSNFHLTSKFGQRWGRLHKGIDLACPVGTTVHASRGGKVVSAGWNGSYGYSVLIDHGDGVKTRYAHMSKITVKVGDRVSQGDKLGKSGNTGRSTGPHCHFEIIIDGTPTNPLKYL